MVKFVPAQTWAAIVLLPAASNPRNYAGQFIAKCGVQDLLADSNPMVVANAVAALAEIQEVSSKNVMPLNQSAHGKLLRALNECTEWGQVSCCSYD